MRLVLPIALGIAAGIGGLAASPALPAVSATPSDMRLSGDVPPALYPGARAQPVPLTLHNPTDAKVYFTRVTITVQSTGTRGCRGDWFRTSRIDVPRNGIAVPARSSVTLPAGGVAAPTIRMLDSGTDQGACQNAKVSLRYSARARAGSQRTPATGQEPSSGGASGNDAGPLPFTGFELGLMAALGILALLSGVGVRRAARARGDR